MQWNYVINARRNLSLAYLPRIVNHRLVVRRTVYRKTLHTLRFDSLVVQRLRYNHSACTQSEMHWCNCLPSAGPPVAVLSRRHFVRLINSPIPLAPTEAMLLLSLETSHPISVAFFQTILNQIVFFRLTVIWLWFVFYMDANTITRQYVIYLMLFEFNKSNHFYEHAADRKRKKNRSFFEFIWKHDQFFWFMIDKWLRRFYSYFIVRMRNFYHQRCRLDYATNSPMHHNQITPKTLFVEPTSTQRR